ncbi:MAG: type II secretion system F family protein [Planctomycetota bacterium]|nr:type II secretion system F family protein [Planctomycetota bacterium]MDA1178906.1 type II secretion system F family protein [Planctomycetota bacterium]
MKYATPGGRNSVSLDELLALHEEIAALTRSGVPLQTGLFTVSTDLPGRMRRLTQQVAELLEQGRSLPEALDQVADLPPFYRAVVVSGIRTGRLAAVLEGLTTHLRRLVEFRRLIATSSVYPLAVFALTCIVASLMLPRLYTLLASFERNTRLVESNLRTMEVFEMIGKWAAWAWLLPLMLIALAAGAWNVSSRAMTTQPKTQGRLVAWLPWFGVAQRSGQWAMFCDLLALLLEHRVPWSESLRLAADAVGSWAPGIALHQLADRAHQGISVTDGKLPFAGTPPLMELILSQKLPGTDTVATLRTIAVDLHRQAAFNRDQVRQWLPLLMTLLIASSAVTLYALMVMVPWLWQLQQIAAR